jgi:hypothetical protein
VEAGGVRWTANRFAPKQRTKLDIHNEMMLLLCGCTDAALRAFSLEGLQRKYSRLDPKVVEYELRKIRTQRFGAGE